ncbi:peptide-methionine (S)-S-oxide reductase MsrA [Mangrovimonas sp. DI 80]|uniref:peptide-methionine (S)-S-oxide reductase MsrA n=1 Tax=Mangrovimonas sp. DI 80 TaxID=1779330 RepID=UPI0009756140|nr:peptide-methionine (S)-S-oxide reductase MsrA [Mangrovimonas sp. DI 80]OMP31707.1 peptide-methionine (S)-S-oxide reductase [Mangrovimonas sp. DI 80]
MKPISTFIIALLFFSCNNHAQVNPKQQALMNVEPVEVPMENGLARAYFASGCFWCAEAIYESVKGVEEAISGYSGGHSENPTYEDSNTGRTGHAEAIEVIYDPKVVDFATLVDVYFNSQDPTQFNGQGPDKGSQYRSIIFYQNEEQKQIAIEKKAAWAKKLNTEIAAEIMPFQKFWEAEAYHQDFEKRNPNHPYIKNISQRRLENFKRSCPMLIKNDDE